MTILLLVLARRIQGRHRYHRTGVGSPRRQRMVRLGKWRWTALAFCLAVVLAALVFPIGVIGYWLLRGLVSGDTFQSLTTETINSIYVAILAAVVCVAGSLPVAYLHVRYPGRYTTWLARSAYLGYALPGIVIALSLVFFGANYVPILYQTAGDAHFRLYGTLLATKPWDVAHGVDAD